MELPSKTTIWNKEPKHSRYVLFFAPELIEFINQKRKYRTYRLGSKYDYLNTGDKIEIKENEKNNTVALANITAKETTVFRDLPLETAGHEPYKDKEHQRQVFSGYYKYIGREIIDDDQFLIFDFQIIE